MSTDFKKGNMRGRSEEAGSSPRSGGRHRREKLFDSGDVRLMIMMVLAQSDAHGYELIKAIETLSSGEYAPSPSMIYPNLTALEADELIASRPEEKQKKSYSITADGKEWVNAQEAQSTALQARLSSLAVLGANRREADMQRAVHNFRMALNTRLSRESLSRETRHNIVDILDQAARDIERTE